MLSLEVEFVLGTYRGAHSPFDSESDWPPQGDRLFSALVATWGRTGRSEEGKNALKWLERQDPLQIRAGGRSERSTPGVFVPVNEVVMSSSGRRLRQERRFPTALLHDPIITFTWPDAVPYRRTLASLQTLAANTAYLGKSTSPVRCHFDTKYAGPPRNRVPTKRWVYPGRFDELERDFATGRLSAPGVSVPPPSRISQVPCSVFGDKWVIFYDAGGRRPNIRRTTTATRAMRSAILSTYFSLEAPEVLSGHSRDVHQDPSLDPHLAVFPLANVGWRYSEETIMGLACVLPRSANAEARGALSRALQRLRRQCAISDRDELDIVVPTRAPKPWILAYKTAPPQSSLDPFRYVRASPVWSTVTPICLDRDPPSDREEKRHPDMVAQIKDSCEHIGLPRPRHVRVDRNPAFRGSAPVVSWQNGFKPGRNEMLPQGPPRPYERWMLPTYLIHRPLTHATIVWDREVQGPVALGSGRFIGLGLCLPLELKEG